ncbi:MAG: DUF4124 domain-containing protein [Wenzhouxiangellaceae bacterium]|nr:DUF4124 domain-containing protein [Wenzhouxiangellaceae bacterium]
MATTGLLQIRFLLAMVVALYCMAVSAQEIYKTVDANGNTVYTDQKPSEDAEPVVLRKLTVVDPVDLGDVEAVLGDSEDGNGEDTGSRPGLRILSPQAGETIQNTAYRLEVQTALDGRLPSGAQMVYRIDGEIRETSRALSTTLSEIFRGEHSLTVEVQSSAGQVLESESVTFFMRQHSRLHPNPG